jgi:hypothetical protein
MDCDARAMDNRSCVDLRTQLEELNEDETINKTNNLKQKKNHGTKKKGPCCISKSTEERMVQGAISERQRPGCPAFDGQPESCL